GRPLPAAPQERVRARPPRRPRFLWTPGLGLLALVARRRTEAPDLLAGGVQERQPQLAVARVAEPVQHGHPVRAVLPGLDRDGLALVALRREPRVVWDDDHPGPTVSTARARQVAEGNAPGILNVPPGLGQGQRARPRARGVPPGG